MEIGSHLKEVLLVDDNDADNFLHRRVIRKAGCAERVVVVRDGQEGLDYIETQAAAGGPQPDLILLDINMPRVDGWEFLRRYEALSLPRSVVIVMLTTSLDPDDAEHAQSLKVLSGYLTKPLTEGDLVQIIQTHFAAYDEDG